MLSNRDYWQSMIGRIADTHLREHLAEGNALPVSSAFRGMDSIASKQTLHEGALEASLRSDQIHQACYALFEALRQARDLALYLNRRHWHQNVCKSADPQVRNGCRSGSHRHERTALLQVSEENLGKSGVALWARPKSNQRILNRVAARLPNVPRCTADQLKALSFIQQYIALLQRKDLKLCLCKWHLEDVREVDATVENVCNPKVLAHHSRRVRKHLLLSTENLSQISDSVL